MPSWLNKLGFVLACLAIPILWGWMVNVLFVHWSRRRINKQPQVSDTPKEASDEPTFTDYQI